MKTKARPAGIQAVDSFQAAFWTTKRAMAEAAEAAFRRHGVRAGQQFILIRLWEEDAQTPGELARRLGLATPTVTKAASRMEAAGLLARKPHPTDARLVTLHLTRRGKALRQAVKAEMRHLTDRALASLSRPERTELVRLLGEVCTCLAAPAVSPERPITTRPRRAARRTA